MVQGKQSPALCLQQHLGCRHGMVEAVETPGNSDLAPSSWESSRSFFCMAKLGLGEMIPPAECSTSK